MKKGVSGGVIAAFALAACGSGDKGGTPTTPQVSGTDAQGIYNGADSVGGNAVTGTVLDNGNLYLIYTNGAGVLGVVNGTSSPVNGRLASDAKNYRVNSNAVDSVSVTGLYQAKASLVATIAGSTTPVFSGSGTETVFTGNYSSIYDQAPDPAKLQGSYTGTAGSIKGADAVTLTVSGNSISGQDVGGCTFSGNFSAHNGKNVWDTAITFGGAPCLYPNQRASGIMVVNGNSILAALLIADQSDAYAVAVSK